MIPIILDKRKSRVKHGQTFNKLIKYVEANIRIEQQVICQNQNFENILNYTTDRQEKLNSQEKCISIRTHGVTDLLTAAIEMNAVSARNTRCKNPAFHFVLTWPEYELPKPDAIFDAAEHAIKSLGLDGHQYVLAVHVNTDNIHCHVAVNRIHPETFKSRNIEWANRTIHLAARQSEIKHGWAHDNGIYIVRTDERNNKSIFLNPDHDHLNYLPQSVTGHKNILPAWHDPDSLDSWLKSNVAKSLKHALPTLTDWHALHAWLARYDITLSDTGGGGMRLHATSQESGEVVDIAASKGLRILERNELEKRWGKFTGAQPIPCIAPDFSHLSASQIANGASRFLNSAFDGGIPPDHIIRANESNDIDGAETDEIGNQRGLKRDNSKRADRRDLRAAARVDLRSRFSKYQRMAREEDVDYFQHISEIRAERSQSLKSIREETKAAKLAVRITKSDDVGERFSQIIAIEFERSRHKLQAEAVFQQKWQSLRASRLQPLGWRGWLHEQANLGDQAALSALRGIVYQAQRDAIRLKKTAQIAAEEETEADSKEYREYQFLKLMARLLKEERNEISIRSANINAMRPYETDALLIRHACMQWRVTGNGNVTYSDQGGGHLFTDRGNRITFDRTLVSDEDIRLALIHAQHKFGNQLTLTGDDPTFSARMACLADDMGMTILNPELQSVIANHRSDRLLNNAATQCKPPALKEPSLSKGDAENAIDHPPQQENTLQDVVEANNAYPLDDSQLSQERLRAMVLAIDPHAEFIIPDISNSSTKYSGPVVAALSADDAGQGFAQCLGRGVYILHSANAPKNHNDATIEIKYRDGQSVAALPSAKKGQSR